MASSIIPMFSAWEASQDMGRTDISAPYEGAMQRSCVSSYFGTGKKPKLKSQSRMAEMLIGVLALKSARPFWNVSSTTGSL